MHAKHLFQMPQVTKEDASSLRKLINHVSSHMNHLKALTLNVATQYLLLNHLILTTIDSNTQREWELLTASRTDVPSTEERIAFMESRCKALELLQTTQSMKASTTTPCSSRPAGGKVSNLLYCNVATQLQSPLCNGSHRLFHCDKFLKLKSKQRYNYAKQSQLCFNCLQHYIKNHTCSTHVCRHCHNKHHTLLHIRKTQSVNNRRSVTNQSAGAQGNSTAEVNKYCSFKGKPRNHFYWQKPLLKFETNLVNMYHAGHY
jgi:hypothetical protein